MRTRTRFGAAALCGALLLVAGCGYDATPVPGPEAQSGGGGGTELDGTDPQCQDNTRTASYRPNGSVSSLRSTAGVRSITDDGKLIVGVSADQLQMSYRDPISGVIQGFDNDMAFKVAQALWPNDSDAKIRSDRLVLRVISPAQRFELLQTTPPDGQQPVEMVVRNMTINCERWGLIAFSQEYYGSGQKVLVSSDSELAKVTGKLSRQQVIEGLDGQTVCAPTGTTSLQNIKDVLTSSTPVEVANDSECLVEFQNSGADALSTDDTVLAGMAIQDPYAKVLNMDPLTAEPYGIGVNKKNVDMVRLINAVLEEMRADGSWQASYDKWLKDALGGAAGVQPRAVYRD